MSSKLLIPVVMIFILSSSFYMPLATCKTVYFSYSSFSPNDPNIFMQGTKVLNGSLQLTNSKLIANTANNSAKAYYSKPIQLWKSGSKEISSFNTYFEFVISFANDSTNSSSGGFSFFLAPENSSGALISFSNSTSGSQRQLQHLLAVEFVSFWGNQNSNGSASSAEDTLAAQVSYDGNSKTIAVKVQSLQVSSNPSVLNISQAVDVKQVLPDKVIVGFSATNGSNIVVQKITKWNFTSSIESPKGFKIWWLAPIMVFILAVLATVISCCLCEGSLKKKILEVMSMLSGEILVLVCTPFFCCSGFMKEKFTGKDGKFGDMTDDEFSRGTGPRRFSYKELASATNNFSEKRKLGEGGFGGVYRGILNKSGQEVAVKKISRKSKQGKKEFASEVKIISSLRHRNLVQLIGWSNERDKFLLVYEFLPNGSLDYHLFNAKTSLPWPFRYNIALGLASALLYLHEEWEQCVVHRDIKPSNVMLDSDFNAKLGDFGLARLVDHKLGQQTTLPAGTFGYLAPECFITRKASKESDVYSFGMVLLEISTGRRAVEHNKNEDEVRLVEWVWNMNGIGNLLETVDPSLGMNFDVKQMECLMVVGLWCAHPDQTQRPTMRQVIQALTFEGRVPTLPRAMPVPIFAPPTVEESNSSNPPSVTWSLVVGR